MKLTIEINCDNAAFSEQEGGPSEEISRILTDWISQHLDGQIHDFFTSEDNDETRRLYDTNGNHVGKAILS